MNNKLNIPWHRYGLITELAKRLKGKSPQFGKTALQKMIYLLQEAYEIDCGYDFSLYTYGPFSSDVLMDLGFAESAGGIVISHVTSGTGGYLIEPGPRGDMLCARAVDFLQKGEVQNALDRLVEDFGECLARDLELYSTTIYVAQKLSNDKDTSATQAKVAEFVQQVKPRFLANEIKDAIRFLQEKQFIKLAA